jgi:hypothetical protein
MDRGMRELAKGFSDIGKFIKEVFESEFGLYLIVLIVITILFANILRMLLSKIPIFIGEGTNKVNSYGNVTAWCMAILGTVAIGWKTKGNVDGLIRGLAGPYGIFLVIALATTAGYGVYKGLENFRKIVRIWLGFLVGAIIYAWMAGSILGGNKGILIGFITAAILGSILGLLWHVK